MPYTPDDLAKLDAFVRSFGRSYRLVWLTPEDEGCPPGVGPHYAWQRRVKDPDPPPSVRSRFIWETEERFATLAEFVAYHGIAL